MRYLIALLLVVAQQPAPAQNEADLSKVDEIGFTDLMAGSGHGQGGWSRIDWIEVYGVTVKR